MHALAHPPTAIGTLLPLGLLGVLGIVLLGEAQLLPLPRLVPLATMAPATVVVPAGRFDFRPSGDYLADGLPVSAPLETGRLHPSVEIMREQVTAADYARCVAAGACPPAHPRHTGIGNIPAAGVSYNHALAYAAWLSAETGETWRLPTVEEWDFAAAGLAVDHGTRAASDPDDPARLWLDEFARQSADIAGLPVALQPAGSFGVNRLGVADMGGNVWEWTTDCYSRTRLDATGNVLTRLDSCGVRTLEGRHRMPMAAFVEDARGGACSMGIPPDNIGFRLVRQPGWLDRLLAAFA